MTHLLAGSLDPRGPVAETMADLWWLMLGLGMAVFVAFAVLLGMGLFRRHTPRAEVNTEALVARWIVGGGVVMPIVVLIVVFGATVYAMRTIPTTGSQDAVEVEVVGHQWWFEIRYPDEGVSARNELHLPLDRRVVLKLTSADVIHSLWVPALGGKMDMLPEDINTLVLQADEPGEYHAQCAEFCGLHHAEMKLLVVAEPADEFTAWLADQR